MEKRKLLTHFTPVVSLSETPCVLLAKADGPDLGVLWRLYL